MSAGNGRESSPAGLLHWRTTCELAGSEPDIAVAAVLCAGATVLSACGPANDAVETVTSNVVVTGSPQGPSSSAAPSSHPSSAAASTTTSVKPSSVSSAASSAPSHATATGPSKSGAGSENAAAQDLPQYQAPTGDVVYTEPDGFKITKMQSGDTPPQFIVVSFDGVGWHEKWQYWKDLETKVPFHFTGFLSGTYMLTDQTKDKYQGPGHGVGKASIGWNAASDLPIEIGDLNDAMDKGDEIGTHFNGHFCSDNPPGGNDWNTADWNNELDQFFSLVKNVDANNGISDELKLSSNLSEVQGERTPCLEGHAEDLYPALVKHGMTYDSSFTRPGISWPKKSPEYKVWNFGMSEFPIHGTGHTQITMDYNFWFTQEAGQTASPDKAAQDSEQVKATYEDMYKAAINGNHAPLVLGNHFNDWNNNAYSDAIGNFVQETCGKADTYCVPFRDVVDWMNAQDPSVLADLQAKGPELGGCPETKFPKCDGTIQY